MKITDKFQTITLFQSEDFKKWFDMEYEDKKSVLFNKVLERSMLDEEILNEFKPTELTLGEVFNYLTITDDKDNWMIFYCRDKDNVLRAVGVRWFGVGWRVHAYPVEYPGGWHGGRRVLSRNPFNTQKQTLNSSVTLTLEERVEKLEAQIKQILK